MHLTGTQKEEQVASPGAGVPGIITILGLISKPKHICIRVDRVKTRDQAFPASRTTRVSGQRKWFARTFHYRNYSLRIQRCKILLKPWVKQFSFPELHSYIQYQQNWSKHFLLTHFKRIWIFDQTKKHFFFLFIIIKYLLILSNIS